MAKADLSNREKRAAYGAVLRRACVLAGFQTRELAADALQMDPGQLGKWWSGEENPQTWRFTSHLVLAPALLLAQAEVQQGAVVRMSIELVRQPA